MTRWAIIFTACIVGAVLLSGCLGIKAPPVSRPEAPAILVDYQKVGGIAGLDNRMVIFTNGAGLLSGKNVNLEISLNRSELARIDEIFSTARFSQLEPSYTSRRGGADLIRYSITYKNMTVTTEDTAIPPALEPVIEEMNRLLESNMVQQKSVNVLGNFTG